MNNNSAMSLYIELFLKRKEKLILCYNLSLLIFNIKKAHFKFVNFLYII